MRLYSCHTKRCDDKDFADDIFRFQLCDCRQRNDALAKTHLKENCRYGMAYIERSTKGLRKKNSICTNERRGIMGIVEERNARISVICRKEDCPEEKQTITL